MNFARDVLTPESLTMLQTIAQLGSFAAAAQQLRVAKSVVTARVQQLEEYVGAPLLHRTTRSVKLTELGVAYVKDCAELLGRSNALLDDMRKTQHSPEGKLRIHALPGFVLGHLAAQLQAFQQLHPAIKVYLFVSDTVIDPVKDFAPVSMLSTVPMVVVVPAALGPRKAKNSP